ncbi:MAG: hypothetical protein KBD47_03115 [Candidatus Pacebacteria bacterium]|jgi:hypothetical protein|nr:hypothetical protein [Candidatus Paceibacterota bacterium]
MKILISIVVALAAIVSLNAAPAVQSNAKFGDGIQLLEGPLLQRHGISRASEPGPIVGPRTTIVSFWVEGPTKANPNFSDFASGVARGIINGNFPTNRAMDFTLVAEHLTTSLERIPWNVIMVFPRQGDKVRLSDLVTEVTCPQDVNLNEIQTFGQAAYAPTAIGILNNEFVTSGPATREVDFFVLLVATKSYTVSFPEVRQWVEIDNDRFDITMKSSIAGVSALSTISSTGYGVLYPQLFIELQGASVLLGHPLGNPGRSYAIVGYESLVSRTMRFIGNVTGTEEVLLSVDGPMEFFQSIGL